jgi:hypothetical protein
VADEPRRLIEDLVFFVIELGKGAVGQPELILDLVNRTLLVCSESGRVALGP